MGNLRWTKFFSGAGEGVCVAKSCFMLQTRVKLEESLEILLPYRGPRCGGLSLSLISSVFHLYAWVGWLE